MIGMLLGHKREARMASIEIWAPSTFETIANNIDVAKIAYGIMVSSSITRSRLFRYGWNDCRFNPSVNENFSRSTELDESMRHIMGLPCILDTRRAKIEIFTVNASVSKTPDSTLAQIASCIMPNTQVLKCRAQFFVHETGIVIIVDSSNNELSCFMQAQEPMRIIEVLKGALGEAALAQIIVLAVKAFVTDTNDGAVAPVTGSVMHDWAWRGEQMTEHIERCGGGTSATTCVFQWNAIVDQVYQLRDRRRNGSPNRMME